MAAVLRGLAAGLADRDGEIRARAIDGLAAAGPAADASDAPRRPGEGARPAQPGDAGRGDGPPARRRLDAGPGVLAGRRRSRPLAVRTAAPRSARLSTTRADRGRCASPGWRLICDPMRPPAPWWRPRPAGHWPGRAFRRPTSCPTTFLENRAAPGPGGGPDEPQRQPAVAGRDQADGPRPARRPGPRGSARRRPWPRSPSGCRRPVPRLLAALAGKPESAEPPPVDRGPVPAARSPGGLDLPGSDPRRQPGTPPGGRIGPAGDPRSCAGPDRRGGAFGRVLGRGGAVARADPGAIRADPRVAGNRAVPPDDAAGLPGRTLDRLRPFPRRHTHGEAIHLMDNAACRSPKDRASVNLEDLKGRAGEAGRSGWLRGQRPRRPLRPSPTPRSTFRIAKAPDCMLLASSGPLLVTVNEQLVANNALGSSSVADGPIRPTPGWSGSSALAKGRCRISSSAARGTRSVVLRRAGRPGVRVTPAHLAGGSRTAARPRPKGCGLAVRDGAQRGCPPRRRQLLLRPPGDRLRPMPLGGRAGHGDDPGPDLHRHWPSNTTAPS